MKDMITRFILSSAGIGVALAVVARIIPNTRVRAFGYWCGRWVSVAGAGRFGKSAWEKIEGFLENSVNVFLLGVKEGLDSDDQGEGTKTKETKTDA